VAQTSHAPIFSRGGSEARLQAAKLSGCGGDWTKEKGAAYPCGASRSAKPQTGAARAAFPPTRPSSRDTSTWCYAACLYLVAPKNWKPPAQQCASVLRSRVYGALEIQISPRAHQRSSTCGCMSPSPTLVASAGDTLIPPPTFPLPHKQRSLPRR